MKSFLIILIAVLLNTGFASAQEASEVDIPELQKQVQAALEQRDNNEEGEEAPLPIGASKNSGREFLEHWIEDFDKDGVPDVLFVFKEGTPFGTVTHFLVALQKDNQLKSMLPLKSITYRRHNTFSMKILKAEEHQIFAEYRYDGQVAYPIFVVHENKVIERSYLNSKAYKYLKGNIFKEPKSRYRSMNNFLELGQSENLSISGKIDVRAELSGSDLLFMEYSWQPEGYKPAVNQTRKERLLIFLKELIKNSTPNHKSYLKEMLKKSKKLSNTELDNIKFEDGLNLSLKKSGFDAHLNFSGYNSEFIQLKIGDYQKIPKDIKGFHWHRVQGFEPTK